MFFCKKKIVPFAKSIFNLYTSQNLAGNTILPFGGFENKTDYWKVHLFCKYKKQKN